MLAAQVPNTQVKARMAAVPVSAALRNQELWSLLARQFSFTYMARLYLKAEEELMSTSGFHTHMHIHMYRYT